jgi:hypothetical protein
MVDSQIKMSGLKRNKTSLNPDSAEDKLRADVMDSPFLESNGVVVFC